MRAMKERDQDIPTRPKVAKTFRLSRDIVEALTGLARNSYGGNETMALEMTLGVALGVRQPPRVRRARKLAADV